MTTLILLAATVLVLALAGPALVRWSTPLLMRAPRRAVGLLLGTVAVWLLAVVALSLVLAGTASGPVLFSDPFSGVCQRCLAAASPFAPATTWELPVPIAVIVLLPVLGIAVQLALMLHRLLRRAASTRAVLDEVLTVGDRTRVAGHDVILVPAQQLLAFALPGRRGGIVVSTGLVETLDAEQLGAVLEHEEAHLCQHHHAIVALLDLFGGPLERVPLISAVKDAVPLLLEVAADDASRRHQGTPALAGALLMLGTSGAHLALSGARARPGVLLHAAGPAGGGTARIEHLVSPPGARASLAPLAVLSSSAVLLAGLGLAVLLPFALLLLEGCARPIA